MHANPSIAHACAPDNTSPKERLIQKINTAPASANNDTAPLHALIKACPRNKDVKKAARLMIAAIEKELASKGVQV